MPCPTVTPVRSCNPRRKKAWTYEQAASRKEKAENFTRDVLEDDERADELEAMSVEDYAEERGVDLVQGDSTMLKRKNATRSTTATATGSRENPAVAALQTATKALDKQNELQARVRELEEEVRDRDSMLDKIVDILEDDDADFSSKDRLAAIEEVFPDDEDDDEGK